MPEKSIAGRLDAAAKEDLACYERLLALSVRAFECLTAMKVEELPGIMAEKEKLVAAIEENSERNASLWPRLEELPEDDAEAHGLSDTVERVREMVEAVQASEEKVAAVASSRSREIQKAMGLISKSGKVLDAYKPTRIYAPRFIDRKG